MKPDTGIVFDGWGVGLFKNLTIYHVGIFLHASSYKIIFSILVQL